jgi:hypothetical protein
MSMSKTIKEILEKLEEFKYISDCNDFCIDCLEVVTKNYVEHWDKKHTIIHECVEHAGISEWIRCIKWLIKNGYLKHE